MCFLTIETKVVHGFIVLVFTPTKFLKNVFIFIWGFVNLA